MSSPDIRIDLKEWECITAEEPGTKLEGVFLESDAEIRSIARALSTSGMLSISELRKGLSLEATSYVGRIALGNLQITIDPKITGMPLLRLFRYAYNLRNLNIFTEAEFSGENSAFQELLIQQLIAEVNELVARGLHRRYVRTEHELTSPRGSIHVQKIARQGGILQPALPCTYHPRLEDCLINQVLLQGLLLAADLTSDSTMRIRLHRLASVFNISAIRLDHHIISRLHRDMDRLTGAYRPAITIIEMLLEAEGLSLDEGHVRLRLPGFLFDMNRFFQDLLSRFLREHLQDCTVQDQYKLRGMLTYDPAHNPRNRRAPEPRPDYMIVKQSRVVAILDAKYRDLWENSLPPDMLYQLAIYTLSQPSGIDAAILYPVMHADAQEAKIVIHDPLHRSGLAHVVLRPVNLLQLDDLISNAENGNNKRARTALAEWLAFGGNWLSLEGALFQ